MNKKIHKRLLSYFLFFVLPVTLFAQGIETNLPMTGTKSKMLKHTKSMDHPQVPTDILLDSTWLHYDDVEMFDSWGFLINGEEYDVVAKWDPADLSPYSGWVISKIKFIVVNSDPLLNLSVIVLEGTDATEIYNQPISSFNANAWTEIILDSAVSFNPNLELYVGYHVDFTGSELGGFVTATDDGPPIDEYGNLYRFDGAWYSDYNNHNLQVFIEAVLSADFEADNTTICPGTSVSFTDLSIGASSWAWVFEGGTPSTSTDQNPTVIYSTPGEYDVELTIWNDDGTTDETTKVDFINVLDIPGQADTPVGEEEVCTNNYFDYTTVAVEYAEDYDWEVDPASAGTLTADSNTATLLVADGFTGDFTIRTRATNICGIGAWSDNFEGTSFLTPTEFDLSDGGEYCEGDENGIEITLSGSQVGVDYELFLDDESTGVIVAGTGNEISFGFHTLTGHYTVVGTMGPCSNYMGGTAIISSVYAPDPAETPVGDTLVCSGSTTDYTVVPIIGADTNYWTLNPGEAGTIIGTGVEISIEWNIDFDGIALLSVQGENQCGFGDVSSDLEITCSPSPSPEVSGPALVCDEMEELYSTVYHQNSSYAWTVSGGTISNGEGTHEITVLWGVPGNGTVSVVETLVADCEGSSEPLEVVIDNCTSIADKNKDTYVVFPNPADNFLNIRSSSVLNSIQMYTIFGQQIISQTVEKSSIQLNTKSLEPGIYWLVVTIENKQYNQRVVVK